MNLKPTSLLLATCLLASSLTGCASMFHGSSQQIAVRSNVADTELFVNEAYIGKGNGVTSLKKKKNYTITARKRGCTDTSVPVSKSFDATTLLGILLDWGVFSILLIDGAATGAWQQFDQESFVIDPRCPEPSPVV